MPPDISPPSPLRAASDDAGRSAAAGTATSLAQLAPGASARIARVEASPLGRRLLDLGFVPGTRIHVLRRAPLGDPTSYELRGTRLCLRRAEAEAVFVQPEDPEASRR